MEKRGVGFALDNLAWLLIAVAVLFVVLLIIGIATGKANAAIEYIKNIFRFGVK